MQSHISFEDWQKLPAVEKRFRAINWGETFSRDERVKVDLRNIRESMTPEQRQKIWRRLVRRWMRHQAP